nr:olfactory receptor 11 [Gregopimpla kuwanae]
MSGAPIISCDSTMEHDTTEKSVTWNSDTTYALGLYKLITRILGIWPPKCEDIFSKTRVALLAFLQITMMASFIGEVNTDCSSINDIVEVISLLACAVLSLLKVVVLRAFRPKMLEIINSSLEDWTTVKRPKSRKIMKNYAKIGRSVCIFQMTSAYVTTIPMIIAALPFLAPEVNATGSNESVPALRGLPLRTVCIFGDMPDLIYALVFTLQALQLLATCTGNIGNDVYFFGITMHLCGQFHLLGEDLESFQMDVDEWAQRKKLVNLIKRHVRLSQLAQYLEDSFNFIILVQLSANAFQMCLMGIQMILSLKLGNTLMVVNTVIVIYVMSLQLFLYSYAGDRLSSQIENLRVSAYFFPWYEFSPKLGRDVLFMIMRNHKSFSITAGKVYRIDIDNFKNLIKALGSYFSVLRIMFDA